MATIAATSGAAPTKFAGLRKRIETGFELLSILVIPALFISSVVISLEILPGVATFAFKGIAFGAILGNGAQSVMMVSIEAAMVGCSVIAKRARLQGNTTIQKKYNRFGYGFFALFVLTLGFFALHVNAELDMGLTLVRCVCAGLYAFVCHGDNQEPPTLTLEQVNHLDALSTTIDRLQSATNQRFTEMNERFTEHLNRTLTELTKATNQRFLDLTEQLSEHTERTVTEGANTTNQRLNDMSEQFTEQINLLAATENEQAPNIAEQQVMAYLVPIIQTLEQHGEALASLPAMSSQLVQIEQSTKHQVYTVVEEVTSLKMTMLEQSKALPKLLERIVNSDQFAQNQQRQLLAPGFALREVNRTKTNEMNGGPNSSPNMVPNKSPNTETNIVPNTFDKGAFVRQCLTETPNIRNAEIQRKANDINQAISAGYISDIRKAFVGFGENEQAEASSLV
jgi:hypothetical protein